MSSILHDRHSKCIKCCGNECSLENRCSDCESWSTDVMSKYVKHCKSLDSKSGKSKKSDESALRSSSGESSSAPLDSAGSHSDSGGIFEARVLELISNSMSQLSDSLAASLEASFVNMETLIDNRISHHVSQDVPNRSFIAPPPVPVCQSPSQGRQDHSLGSPRTRYGNPEGQPEEPVQDESAIPSFLNSLRDQGIELPQGIKLLDRRASFSSEDPSISHGRVPHSANTSGSMGSSVGFGSALTTRTVAPSWMDDSVNAGALFLRGASRPLLRTVSFAESVNHSTDDTASVTSEKPPPQKGLRSVLHLLYHYCPSAASEMPVRALRSCDFESLFASETQLRVEEPPPILFHRVAEIWAQSQGGSSL